MRHWRFKQTLDFWQVGGKEIENYNLYLIIVFDFLTAEAEDDARNSHLLFTLNVYQYKVDHDNSGQEEGENPFLFSFKISMYIFMQLIN